MFGWNSAKRDTQGQPCPETEELKTKWTAINKVMAVIEFDCNGHILSANDNFLAATGYGLDAIINQHHQMFVAPELASSNEYEQFWRRLRSGEFVSGRFLRYRQNGDPIWLEASYNPVFNSDGSVRKIVKFATDISEAVQANADASGQLKAIDRAMAVIEFDLNGIILKANDNFCGAVGYDADELRGQHHRIFVEPSFARSDEYQAFWRRLAAGEFISGTIKRLNKAGEVLWLEATYNPIYNAEGRVYKIVKYATDVGSSETTQELQSAMLEATKALENIAAGRLDQQAKMQIDTSRETMFSDMIDNLSNAINSTVTTLDNVVTEVLQMAKEVSNASDEVAKGSNDMNSRTQDMAAALEQTSSSMEEMTSTVHANTESANKANRLAAQARDEAQSGGQVAQQTVNAMEMISQSSKEIAEIIALVDGIAFQTNLLALNAAVEAARAGEQGRGFAVVAGEVRNLAQKSAEASKDIKALIEQSTRNVESGTKYVNETGTVLASINDVVQQVAEIIDNIAGSSREQTAGIEQISGALTNLDGVTQVNAALVEEASAAAQVLNNQAVGLSRLMSYFQSDQTTGQAMQHGPHSI